MLLFETTRHSVPFNFPPTDYTDDNISYSKKLDSKSTKKKKNGVMLNVQDVDWKEGDKDKQQILDLKSQKALLTVSYFGRSKFS